MTRQFPIRIASRQALTELLSRSSGQHYVYLLADPWQGASHPFYVGIGRDMRLFQHEEEARDPSAKGQKVMFIRRLWDAGLEVARYIDGLHDREPWHREAELIDRWGLLKDGTGILANEQRYAPAAVADGAELRKYADIGNQLPPGFKAQDRPLYPGPRRPSRVSSVYGVILAEVEASPGITGSELVKRLLTRDFSGISSAYTQTGQVSRPWLARYIDGAFYRKNQYLSWNPSGPDLGTDAK